MLEHSLEEWNMLPQSNRQMGAAERVRPRLRWEDSYPEDGLVLKSFVRELSTDGLAKPDKRSWNSDHVWFSRAEARQWLASDPRPAQVHRVPEVISRRLIRYHLVDNARGQTLPFAPQEIETAELSTTVLARLGDLVDFRIDGKSSANAQGPWLLGDNDFTPPIDYPRRMNTHLLGYATYNLQTQTFTRFELLAIGHWEGYTQNNGRARGTPAGHNGYYFTLAPPDSAERVAPGFISIYDAPWIESL